MIVTPASALLASVIVTASYVIYQRFFHPLSVFPGPFWGSITNLWRFYHEWRGDLPAVVHEYHKRHGAFVRVAPDQVNCNSASVVDVVYKKGGRWYPKAEFYNAFTAIVPNLFGTRDEDLHALRRRQMAHAFSQASLVKMEYIFDRHVGELLAKLDRREREREGGEREEEKKKNKGFVLEDVLRYYARDTNGDLSLGVLFGTQEADDPALLSPLNNHVALSKLSGSLPWAVPYLNKYGSMVPWPYLRGLLASRRAISMEAAHVVELEYRKAGRGGEDEAKIDMFEESDPGRINLLTSLVRARDPHTGEFIARGDIAANAMAFLVAGSHSSAATLEILFWYLLHYPDVMAKVVAEIDKAFTAPKSDRDMLAYAGLESKLPYTSAVVTECFRLAPTFQHPVPRDTPKDRSNVRFPTVIDDVVVPPGYAISASIYSIHRNAAIWGPDVDEFRPARWFDTATRRKEGLLMHFGVGHRACIGRNQASLMVWKAMVEILRRFEVELADKDEVKQKQIDLRVCGFAELAKPLRVCVRRRHLPTAAG